MERVCLTARTDINQAYPAYCNFSITGRVVTVTVRKSGYPDGRGNIVMGDEAHMDMDVSVFKQMLGEAVSELILLGSKASEETRALIRKSLAGQLAAGNEPVTGQCKSGDSFPQGNCEG